MCDGRSGRTRAKIPSRLRLTSQMYGKTNASNGSRIPVRAISSVDFEIEQRKEPSAASARLISRFSPPPCIATGSMPKEWTSSCGV